MPLFWIVPEVAASLEHHGFFVRRAVIDRVFVRFGGKCRNGQRKQHTEGKQQMR